MEIIHLILGKANPERMNGVNKVVNEMATNQVQNGYQAQVWGITQNPVHDYPARVFTTRLFAKKRNPFKANKKLLSDLLESKDNIVVHFHGAFIPVFYTISAFLYKNKIPFIITPHSTYNKVMMKKNALLKKIYFRLFEIKLLNRADNIHLLGKTEWEGLASIYHNKKSVLIPYGFTSPHIDLSKYEKASIFTVGYCGRIAIHPKGLDVLLKGFSLFHLACPRSEMIIIGDGKDRAKLEKIALELNISNRVHFKGSAFGESKVNLLLQCHVFAHPSRTDGLPATIVEAASLGLPCIVSEATNTGDYITKFDAGYKMKEMNEESFCKGLKTMYDRITIGKESEKLRQNALQMIDEAFGWIKILKQFDKIYQDAFQKKSGLKDNLIIHKQNEHVA